MPLQARTEFAAAINQIASEKGVDTQIILDAIEQAALAAYRKDLSFRNEPIPDDFEELTAKIDSSSGEIGIYRGEENITPPGFARIAAQTAKQVIAQKLHEAEKGAIIDEYAQKVGTVVSGQIQRQEGNMYFVDLGRAEGVMPPPEQTRGEFYSLTQRLKFLIKEIRTSGRGPEVIVSRADPGLVKGLFAMEVPEIVSGAVEIKEIAREAGGRTKLAVQSTQDGVDPVGALVGQKGVRVQAVINELGEEKIDVILFSEEQERFIASALSPAKDVIVELNEEEKVAKVQIPEEQLSLAIGKGGQNVRLAAKLTGWKIDIEGTGVLNEETTDEIDQLVKDAETGESVDQQVSESVGEAPTGVVSSDSTDSTDNTDITENTEKDAAPADDKVAAAVTEDPAKVEEEVEEKIDEAVKEESADGATEPEPAVEEQAEAAGDAEKDIAADPEMKSEKEPETVEEESPSTDAQDVKNEAEEVADTEENK